MKGDGYIFDPTILREYDIRGIFKENLDTNDAYATGRAFGTIVAQKGGKTASVGYDGRLSSVALEDSLVEGLKDCGLEVFRIGLGPTPMLYFSVHELKTDCGIMVSGSHNPPNYNGFKLMLGTQPFFGEDIKKMGKIASKGVFSSGKGSKKKVQLLTSYVNGLLSAYRGNKELKVAWDAGNGSAGEAMRKLTEKLPGEHILLFDEIDGMFPNHHPDPTVKENLVSLIDTVKEKKCDLGFAFDGDGDRVGLVDELGQILWGDQILAILSKEVLEENPGAIVIADVKSSEALFEEIKKLGGQPRMARTGHSIIKQEMVNTQAMLAGEMSGHIFFADKYFGFDDALYAAVRLLGVVSRSGKPLSHFTPNFAQIHNTPELRFQCSEDKKFTIVEEIKARLVKQGISFVDIDGIRVTNDDGWWLLRASNTQDVLVARCEAKTPQGLEATKKFLTSELNKSGITIPEELT